MMILGDQPSWLKWEPHAHGHSGQNLVFTVQVQEHDSHCFRRWSFVCNELQLKYGGPPVRDVLLTSQGSTLMKTSGQGRVLFESTLFTSTCGLQAYTSLGIVVDKETQTKLVKNTCAMLSDALKQHIASSNTWQCLAQELIKYREDVHLQHTTKLP